MCNKRKDLREPRRLLQETQARQRSSRLFWLTIKRVAHFYQRTVC